MTEKFKMRGGSIHPDVEYIKQDEVGQVIAKGLAEVVKVRPSNPVNFLGQWLLGYQMSTEVKKTVEFI